MGPEEEAVASRLQLCRLKAQSAKGRMAESLMESAIAEDYFPIHKTMVAVVVGVTGRVRYR